ncbi:MAG: bifunctional diguanylate cyclase/phosphodiesterase [Pseudomonadales bacterium]
MGAKSLVNASIFENASLLSGRVDIRQRLQLAIAKARLRKQSVALLFIDLDRFNTITSTLGPEIGQQLVDTLNERLAHALNGDHVLMHVGSDEFAVLVDNVSNASQLRQLGNRLLNIIRKPVYIDEQQLVATASMGISVYPGKAENDQVLLHQALTALHSAKSIGGDGIRFFTRGQSNVAQLRRLNIEIELRQAIARKDLTVHYQPKMDLASGQVTALEALVRWEHDELGMVPPAEFIPIAESAGLISSIGEMVLETACRHGSRWIEDGVPDAKIAVNLSAKQLIRNDMLVVIRRILKRTGFPPERLVVELTESLLIDTLDKTCETLHGLREMGIEIAIDDFGTGYSTFKLLKRLPVDILKIDQMFIQDIIDNRVDAAITKAIIDVAHALDMRVVAEGVENIEHVKLLQELGCDSIQGFYLSEALPRAEITELLHIGVPGKTRQPNEFIEEQACLELLGSV